MYRLGAVSNLLLRAATSVTANATPSISKCAIEALETQCARNLIAAQSRWLNTSSALWAVEPAVPPTDAPKVKEEYKYLLDKDIWDEAWAHEPRFGTVDSPIVVPSIEPERIIGVTDPDDDTLVIWGILCKDDPPKQLVEGGEFFVLQLVEHVPRVGDVTGAGLK